MTGNSISVLSDRARPSRPWNITLWILQVLVAVIFLMTGVLTLAGEETLVAAFNQIGAGQWFRYFTGGLELISVILLLIPKTAMIGAALLAAMMGGAIAAYLFIIGGSPALPMVLLMIILIIAWKRRPAWLKNRE